MRSGDDFAAEEIFFVRGGANVEELVSGEKFRDAELEIVGRECRGPGSGGELHGTIEGENTMGAAELGGAESGGFGFTESAEFGGAAMNGFAGDLQLERSGFCARAGGIREDVKVCERERTDEAQGRFVIGFGFTGEAGDDIGSDRSVGEKFADELYAAGVVFGAIPAMHGAENVVRAGLKRHVEMMGDASSTGEKRDEILRDVERLDGAYAEAWERSFVEDAA